MNNRVENRSKGLPKKIEATCKEVVLCEEMASLKKQVAEQLKQAKNSLAKAQQQVVLWDTKIKQLTGSLAVCNVILKNYVRTVEETEKEEKL